MAIQKKSLTNAKPAPKSTKKQDPKAKTEVKATKMKTAVRPLV